MLNRMKRSLPALFMASILVLTSCSTNATDDTSVSTSTTAESTSTSTETPADAGTVEVTDAHGTVVVPVNPEVVVSLDSRSFETLETWGIELAAAPKAVIPADSSYATNDDVQDIGNHREPNLEIIAAVEPDLVIVGQRFAGYYEEIKTLVPETAVIDLNFDVSEASETPGANLENGLKEGIETLAAIFSKQTEAEALIAEFDEAVAAVKEAYNGTDTVMGVNVSGGNIGYAAPMYGRVWGPLFDLFDWVPALDVDDASSDHQGDDISVEAIAQSNPDWLMVLDRDAAVSSTEDASPAQDVIDNSEALQNVTAIQEEQLVYAPDDTYTNESIHTFIELFNDLAEAFSN